VVLTSNQEREFPPAFLRRCVQLEIAPPGRQRLGEIVEAHLGSEVAAAGAELITRFLERRDQGELATDQLLNTIYVTFHAARADGRTRHDLADLMLQYLQAPSMR
jgi:MoxR-like ATPase